MNNIKQIKIAQNAQVKFHQFLYRFQNRFTLPEFKAIRDISRGILSSGSIIINQVACEINEKTTLKKTAERLYRNLKHRNLHERLNPMILEHQCCQFDQETVIIVDESDIVKNSATRMEGLNKVRDGSKGTFNSLGYDLLNIIAYQKQLNGYKILPVSSDLYSSRMEADSISNILYDRIDDITISSENKGVFVFDRGFDSRILINHLASNGNSFIIRGVGKRNVIVENQELPFAQVCKAILLSYKHPGISDDEWFECGVKRVSIRTDPCPRKEASTVDVWLVKACRRNIKDNRHGYFYFLCDFPNQKLSETDIMSKTLSSYKLRWLIEQAHRHIKQDYSWEAMQLKTYNGLKNLNSVLWLSLCFLYAQKENIIEWMEACPRQFEQYRKKIIMLFEFVYTALMKAVKRVFILWKKYEHKLHDKEPMQLRFNL